MPKDSSIALTLRGSDLAKLDPLTFHRLWQELGVMIRSGDGPTLVRAETARPAAGVRVRRTVLKPAVNGK